MTHPSKSPSSRNPLLQQLMGPLHQASAIMTTLSQYCGVLVTCSRIAQHQTTHTQHNTTTAHTHTTTPTHTQSHTPHSHTHTHTHSQSHTHQSDTHTHI